MSKGSLLRLTVIDEAGHPVENARLMLQSAPVPVPEIAALSNSQGEASIFLPASGRYELGCYSDHHKQATLTINFSEEAASQTVVLEKDSGS